MKSLFSHNEIKMTILKTNKAFDLRFSLIVFNIPKSYKIAELFLGKISASDLKKVQGSKGSDLISKEE